jgi:predicted permease
MSLGSLGCVLGSLAIAGIALTRRRKDIVSLCTPIFAAFIFVFPLETAPGLPMQLLYAATLTGLVVRLEKRFPA